MRRRWSPEIALRYGLRPWEMGQLTLGEYRQLQRHHNALARTEEAV